MADNAEIDKKIKSLENEKKANHTNKLESLIKNKYVIFSHAHSVFIDPGFDVEYFYYVNPANDLSFTNEKPNFSLITSDKMDAFNAEEYLSTLAKVKHPTKDMDNMDIELEKGDLEDNGSGKFFFNEEQVKKLISHAPKDIQPTMKRGIRPAKFIITHGNNDDVSMFAYHD